MTIKNIVSNKLLLYSKHIVIIRIKNDKKKDISEKFNIEVMISTTDMTK